MRQVLVDDAIPVGEEAVDVMVSGKNGDTVFLVTPVTRKAIEWVDEHVQLEPWQWHGSGFVVEHRYVDVLVKGMMKNGLVVHGE